MFDPKVVPVPRRFPFGFPAAAESIDGAGGTTLLASDGAPPVVAGFEFTKGGGGTTSCVPKILPIMLLISEPLPDCEGGGGTTERAVSGRFPPESRRMSEDRSAEGGGATTAGAGNESFAFLVPALSGAETGGGTTAESIA
jgi:hypothetical protein